MINDLTGRKKTHRNEETDWDYVMDSLLCRRFWLALWDILQLPLNPASCILRSACINEIASELDPCKPHGPPSTANSRMVQPPQRLEYSDDLPANRLLRVQKSAFSSPTSGPQLSALRLKTGGTSFRFGETFKPSDCFRSAVGPPDC
jgi:hypothetical protein